MIKKILFARTLLLSSFVVATSMPGFSNIASAHSGIDDVDQHDVGSLSDLSLEQLMGIQVVTASRRAQDISSIPSAVFVITQDDIRRSGVTSIPEALRMAPGVQVARLSTDKWSISIRGFNGRYANNIQVLVDGRSVYNALFSGTLWEQVDTYMEDIDRIEVVRGPSAAVWGANAVNGVINIITKKASETQGLSITAGGGSFERGFIGGRYGGTMGDHTSYRVYAKGFTRQSLKSNQGKSTNSEWHDARGGFRLDHEQDNDEFTAQGDFYYRAYGDTIDKTVLAAPLIQIEKDRASDIGGNIRLRWERALSDESSFVLQTYYSHSEYDLKTGAPFREHSFDIDANHSFVFMDHHRITWGANYRLYHNKVHGSEIVTFNPRVRTKHQFGLYVRDDISLIPSKLNLVIGTRFDHNDYTGFEIEPNIRLIWTPDQKNSIWGAVSRAVRTPSRAENDIKINVQASHWIPLSPERLPIPALVQYNGKSDFKSEKLLAFELGYRHKFSQQASIDIATFYNRYSDMRNVILNGVAHQLTYPPHILVDVGVNNDASGETYGVEVSADWRVRENWRLQANYTFLRMHIHSDSLLKTYDPVTGSASKVSPKHQFAMRSNYDFSERLQLNLWLHYISSVDLYDIAGYITMDAKLAYQINKNTELFVVGQNFLQKHHREIESDFIRTLPSRVPRGIYAGFNLQF